MTREKAIKDYVTPALKHTWNEKINKEVLEALEQESTTKNNLSSGLEKNSKKLEKGTTKNDLGVDAVSRKAVLNQIFYSTDNSGDVVLGSALRERIARLPSVTPQEPRKGRWMKSNIGGAKVCSVCNAHMGLSSFKYCPNCGCAMRGDESGNE